MVQGTGCLGLLLKSRQAILVTRKCSRENFDGDVTIQFFITRQINFAHAALANF